MLTLCLHQNDTSMPKIPPTARANEHIKKFPIVFLHPSNVTSAQVKIKGFPDIGVTYRLAGRRQETEELIEELLSSQHGGEIHRSVWLIGLQECLQVADSILHYCLCCTVSLPPLKGDFSFACVFCLLNQLINN